MKRRTFLKASLASAGALVLGPFGCGDSGGGRRVRDGAALFPQSVASGDPGPGSVILWTRLVDPAQPGDAALALEVATDPDFDTVVTLEGGASLALVAEAAFDHCVKVRVSGLAAGTTYWYRFLVEQGGETWASQTGRTKTAPAEDADVPVTLAVLSCQDYNGRYYNTLKRLADLEVDLVVHLGDYIYETTGDPSFQTTSGRRVAFGDEAGAIAFNAGTDDAYFAAASLDNYRDLYRTYRADKDLQRVHERFAMSVIQDDHEFSDDCWGEVATYTDGEEDEREPARRLAADQAWFEYMPVDYPGDPTFRYDPATPFPGNLRIYRDLRLGRHVHLVLTDLRRFRSDHLVPEDAFPGALAADQDALELLGPVPDLAVPYVDVDAFQGGQYATLLTDHAAALGWEPARITGALSVPFINEQVTALNEGRAPQDAFPLIDEAAQAGLPRGLAWHQLFKRSQYSMLGSRYLVDAAAFDLLAAVLEAESDGTREVALGATQKQWLIDTLTGSTATWKVWGSEFVFMPRLADLSGIASLPPFFKRGFWLSAEDWDGMPNRREELLQALGGVDNVVIVNGDLHSWWAGTPWSRADPSLRLVEVGGGAVSSGTYEQFLFDAAASDPALQAVGAPLLALAAGGLLMDKTLRPNPHMAYNDLNSHGFLIVEAGPDDLVATIHSLEAEAVTAPLTEEGEALAARFQTVRFRVLAGSKALYRDVDGAWKRWDEDALDWV